VQKDHSNKRAIVIGASMGSNSHFALLGRLAASV
jgi:hypothetical protein